MRRGTSVPTASKTVLGSDVQRNVIPLTTGDLRHIFIYTVAKIVAVDRPVSGSGSSMIKTSTSMCQRPSIALNNPRTSGIVVGKTSVASMPSPFVDGDTRKTKRHKLITRTVVRQLFADKKVLESEVNSVLCGDPSTWPKANCVTFQASDECRRSSATASAYSLFALFSTLISSFAYQSGTDQPSHNQRC